MCAPASLWPLQCLFLSSHGIHYIIHYLDDFLIPGKPASSDCEQALTHMLHICRQLGFPIAEGKIEGPATILVFLGTLLDTVKLETRPPEDKLAALKALLQQWRTTKKTTKRELLSLIGSLSFIAKVIPAGREKIIHSSFLLLWAAIILDTANRAIQELIYS